MHDGQHAGIGARTLQVKSNVPALKMLVQQPRRQTASPFVEIAEHDARPRPPGVTEDGLADQFARLMPALNEGGSEVHVINMQPSLFRPLFRHADIHAQTSALFAPGHADIVILKFQQREAAEHEVAVNSLPQLTVMSHAIVKAQFARDVMRLIGLAVAPLYAEDFLQRDDVGLNLLQHAYDSLRAEPPINSDTFMHVVSDDSKFIALL